MQVLTSLAPCRHCGRLCPASRRRRGLCRSNASRGCYYDQHAKENYPYTGTLSGMDGEIWTQDVEGEVPQPERTEAQPGSPEKRRAIQTRARRRQALFHPQDPTLPLREAAMSPRLAWLWRLLIGVDPTIADDLRTLARLAAGPTLPSEPPTG